MEQLPLTLTDLGTFAGCLARLQRLSSLGLAHVTLDGRDPDPEGAGCLGVGHASADGVHDLLTEVFRVRFHRSTMPCSPSSLQLAVSQLRYVLGLTAALLDALCAKQGSLRADHGRRARAECSGSP